jgi:hypothetical protein
VTVDWFYATLIAAALPASLGPMAIAIANRHFRSQPKRARQWTEVAPGKYELPLDGKMVLTATDATYISPEIRAELDQSPEWWDERFHNLLVATDQPYLEYGEVEYIEERSLGEKSVVYTPIPRQKAYLSCTCGQCRAIREMGCDPRD